MINRPPVQSIEFINTDGNPHSYVVGRAGITRITEVEECGECSFINWCEVWADDKLVARFPQNRLDAIRY